MNASDTTVGPAGGERSKTIKEIVAKRDAALKKIHAEAQDIQRRQIELQDLGQNGPPKDDEIAEFIKNNQALDALSEAAVEFKFVAVEEATASAEAIRLAGEVQKVNNNLKEKLAHVKGVAQRVKRLSEMFATIEGIVTALTRLAALV